jgi:dUTPase
MPVLARSEADVHDFDDVRDCHASIYGDLRERSLPYSENRKEGVVPKEFVRAPRLGRICVEAFKKGAFLPTKSETQRAGLTLRGQETAEIQQGHSVEVTAGLRLVSFIGKAIRVTQSVLGPGSQEKIRTHATLLTHEGHGCEIVFTVTNFGCIPYVVSRGDCVGQIQVVGVDDVECDISDASDTEICLDELACAMAAHTAPCAEPQPGCQYNPKSYKKPCVGHQSAGGARNNQVVWSRCSYT